MNIKDRMKLNIVGCFTGLPVGGINKSNSGYFNIRDIYIVHIPVRNMAVNKVPATDILIHVCRRSCRSAYCIWDFAYKCMSAIA